MMGCPMGENRLWWGYGRVYLCNIADVTENKWVTRTKLGGKTLTSKNVGDVAGTSTNLAVF